METLDELDLQILKLLQADGRATNVEIGRQLDQRHTRIRDRINRMTEAGVITGYRVEVNPLKLGHHIHALVHVEADQEHDFDAFADQLLAIPEVVEVMNVTGDYDAIVRVWARDVTHLRTLLYNKISTLEAHKKTVSSLILKRWETTLGLSDDAE